MAKTALKKPSAKVGKVKGKPGAKGTKAKVKKAKVAEWAVGDEALFVGYGDEKSARLEMRTVAHIIRRHDDREPPATVQ